jgi:hypothetical protein
MDRLICAKLGVYLSFLLARLKCGGSTALRARHSTLLVNQTSLLGPINVNGYGAVVSVTLIEVRMVVNITYRSMEAMMVM